MDDARRAQAEGRGADAERLYRQAMQDPGSLADAGLALAQLLYAGGRLGDALAVTRQVADARPDLTAAWLNLATLERVAGRPDAALALYRRLLARDPDLLPALEGYGALAVASELFEEGAAALRRAVALQPGFARAWANLGTAETRLGDPAAAARAFAEAQRLDPDSAEARYGLAVARLQLGDLVGGFGAYDARLVTHRPDEPYLLPPTWSGEPFPGRTLLLQAEQGAGDAIQFIRFAAAAKGRGGTVVVEAAAPLARLLAGAAGVDRVVVRTDRPPAHDLVLPLMSLPRVLGTTWATVPTVVPYLRPDPGAAAAWAERLTALPRPRIGVVWAGSPGYRWDATRSPGLAALRRLAAVPGIGVAALQVGAGRAALEREPLPAGWLDLGPALDDFATTAAVIANLDLVISGDTGTAHLAGALACPTWILLSRDADWRWLTERSDCPWYPTVRLFRQPRAGDWTAVMSAVIEALECSVIHP